MDISYQAWEMPGIDFSELDRRDLVLFKTAIIANYKFFAIAFAISFVISPILIKIMPKLGYIDIPKDKRRIHKKAMPLGGGLAIFIAFLATALYGLSLNREYICLFIGSGLIVISGLIDDKVNLSPKKKLMFQILAGLTLIFGGVKINFFTNPFFAKDLIWLSYLSIPITLFWIIGITNTVNLIDGLDGLAAGISMISAASISFIAFAGGSFDQALMGAILAGACLGFLPYNFNPAKIFMGDTGALFLGYVLSYISIQGFMKSATVLTIFVPVLILGVPVFDTTFAMIRRKLSGQSIMQADKGHLHHRLLGLGLSQRQTVSILYIISMIFGILANLIADFNTQKGLLISALIIIGIVLVAWASGMFKGPKTSDKSKEEE